LQAGEGQAIAAEVPSLVRHPDAPPGAIQSIEAELERMSRGAIATFRIRGDMAKLVLPPPASHVRADELWKTTCFEVFVASEGADYREFNLSPSGQWAAYSFDSYRSGIEKASADIEIRISSIDNGLQIIAEIIAEFPNPALVGLTAVIEERDGPIRYWSTAFAPGKPDFHAAAVRSLLFDGVSAE
jgi:hypothetical protein